MSEPDKGDAKTSFWKTLPGVLTGVAALLTALGGFVVIIVPLFGGPATVAVPSPNGQPPAASGPPAALPSSQVAPASTPPADPGSSTSSEGGVLHRDRLELSDADFADLETGRIGQPPPNDDLYLHGTDELLASYGITPVQGPVTKAACAAALTDRSYTNLRLTEVAQDDWLCVQTKEGHLGGMRIVQRAGPGQPVVILEYELWA